MERQVARRRTSIIAAHFVPTDDMPPTHLLPMNCSSSLNSVLRRCDNRMYFARQGSASHAFFMREASNDNQGIPVKPADVPLKTFASSNKRSCNNAAEAPAFSRPTKISETKFELIQPPPKSCESSGPNFAGPITLTTTNKHFKGIEWSPRMDVAEYARNYIMTVEIPGVNANGIRVEVNDQNLKVMGKRSTRCWRTRGYSNDQSIAAYHKREILQGPYQVVWPLPSDVNKDSVSAEFRYGLLQIIIPKTN